MFDFHELETAKKAAKIRVSCPLTLPISNLSIDNFCMRLCKGAEISDSHKLSILALFFLLVLVAFNVAPKNYILYFHVYGRTVYLACL